MNALRIYTEMKQKPNNYQITAIISVPVVLFAITMSTCTAIAVCLGCPWLGELTPYVGFQWQGAPVGGHMWTQPGMFASPGKVHVFAEHHLDTAWGWEAMASKNLQNQSEC